MTALRPYAALEARRNRLLYAGWPIVILGSLPLAGAIAAASGVPTEQGVGAALFAWALAGLPFTALLFGAVAGAGLRGRAEEDEAALPLSLRTRAFGGLAAAAGGLAASAALVTMAIALVPEAQHMLLVVAKMHDRNWYWNPLFNPNMLPPLALAAPLTLGWLLTTAFGAGLVSAQPVLGGVSALCSGALALTPLIAGLTLEQVYADQAGSMAPALGCLLFLAGGALASLAQAAPLTRRARRPTWRQTALLAVLPLAGTLAAWAAFYGARQ